MVPAIGVFLKVVLSENSILDVHHAVFTQKTFKNTTMAGVIGVWSWPYPYGRDHRGIVPAIPLGPHYFVLQAVYVAVN